MATAKKTTKEASKNQRFVLVTTAHRGVFAGWCDDWSGDKITLRNARCALYWSADVGGFLGLAEIGPTPGCKISAESQELTLTGITSVSQCTANAINAWSEAKVQGRP
jgi:hypothetical protein